MRLRTREFNQDNMATEAGNPTGGNPPGGNPPGNPPNVPAFCLTPGHLNINQPLDYSTKTGMEIYKKCSMPLDGVD